MHFLTRGTIRVWQRILIPLRKWENGYGKLPVGGSLLRINRSREKRNNNSRKWSGSSSSTSVSLHSEITVEQSLSPEKIPQKKFPGNNSLESVATSRGSRISQRVSFQLEVITVISGSSWRTYRETSTKRIVVISSKDCSRTKGRGCVLKGRCDPCYERLMHTNQPSYLVTAFARVTRSTLAY